MNKIIPVLFCHIYKDGRVLTDKCPICGLKHEHSGDLSYGAYQGLREPHCFEKDNPKFERYALIAKNLIHKDTYDILPKF